MEDNQINQQLIKSVLEKYGHDYVVTEDGLEAIEVLEKARNSQQPFELVLMDIEMPNLDGIETTKQIRAMGLSSSRLPIIAMTANAYDQDIQDALAAGMQAHLAKPLNVVKLLALLDEWIPSSAVPH